MKNVDETWNDEKSPSSAVSRIRELALAERTSLRRRVGEISRHFPPKRCIFVREHPRKRFASVPVLIPSPYSCWYLVLLKTIRENRNEKNRGIVYYRISGTTMNLSWIWFTVLFRRVWQVWIYVRWRRFTSPILDTWYIARQIAALI